MIERKRETLALTMPDGAVVRGELSFAEADARVPVVIFAHGLGSVRGGEKAVALEAECARRGWAFAACDFRGHGASSGTMLELRGSRLLEDLDAITRTVTERIAGPLCLFGSSMGGWAAAWFAARHPERVAACAFVAPAFRFLEWNRLSQTERDEWQRTGRHRVCNEFIDLELGSGLIAEASDFQFETLAERFRSPLIIFHGMRDDLVPDTQSLEFAARCASTDVEVVITKQGDHRLNHDKEKIARAACDFFAAR